jgi:hypothetical protein
MHVQAGYFDNANLLGTSISISHINLNEFEQRIKKLVLLIFMYKNSSSRARACMHFQKKMTFVLRIYKRLTIILESFILILPVVSENIRGQKKQTERRRRRRRRRRNRVNPTCSPTSCGEHNNNDKLKDNKRKKNQIR